MTNDLQIYYPLYQSKVIEISDNDAFFHFKRNWDLNDQRTIPQKKVSQSATVSLCPSAKHSKLVLRRKNGKKKSELFSLFWNTLTSHQQIIIFLKTSTSLCNGEYHTWAAYTSTAWCNTSPRKLFSCFEKPHNWETHKTQTMLCAGILNWQARTECLRIKTSLKKNF